jgi:hypothetical protein
LIQVKPTTGALLKRIGVIRTADRQLVKLSDLAMQPGTDMLFGISSVAHGPGTAETAKLYVIDTSTAVATLVGDTGLEFGGGLAFAPDGTLYQASFRGPIDSVPKRVPCLFTLDPETGQITSEVSLKAPNGKPYYRYVIAGLAVRPADGTVFGSGSITKEGSRDGNDPFPMPNIDNLLAIIDPTTGVLTHLGRSPNGIGEKMGDLAFHRIKKI